MSPSFMRSLGHGNDGSDCGIDGSHDGISDKIVLPEPNFKCAITHPNNLRIIPLKVMDMNILFLLLLPLFLLIFKHLTNPSPKNLPPGPRPWPIIGNILQIGRKPHISITHFANLHGLLISLKLGSQLLVVGSSPAAATEILKTHDRQLSARYTPKVTIPSLRPLSLVWAGECNEHWKSLRSLCRTELFSVKAIELQAGLRERKVGEMVEFVGSKEKEGKGVKIGEVVFATVFNILGNICFSKYFIELKDEGVAGGLKGVIWKMMELGTTPNGLRKKAMEYQEEVYRMWEVIITERKESEGVDASRQHDFLDVMLSCQFSDMQINLLILELFIAGTDTTTSTIEWAMAEVVKNKEAMEKLREELGKEIGAESINESHMSQLPYLHACVKETLRLHPPAFSASSSYTIPQNTQVIVNVWAIGRDPTIWEDPLSFKPKLFLDSKLDFRGQDFELLPFGAGRRMCPGLPLGIKQVHLILASLVHRFEWLLPNNEDPLRLDMNEKFGITLQKEQPLLLIPKQKPTVSQPMQMESQVKMRETKMLRYLGSKAGQMVNIKETSHAIGKGKAAATSFLEDFFPEEAQS
ncbi:hypothetical protein RJ639_013820 [Escallonia herrerae]|uniref:Cytochrome P450 n=1 Tax=Escallonia herrerae TaxID=1293975 RepID=A0AA88VIG4_9ASTE|nr:hypothetical protein RJ639_013820 [Escallonia herrerae]